jgi:uncharacterized protein
MIVINIIGLILVILGALNWGLWGFFQFDFVAWISGGNTSGMARGIYSLIGLGGLWSINLFARSRFLKGHPDVKE